MSTLRCPGQDRRFWKSKDIFEVQCPYCEHILEFWKDDPLRHCLSCGKEVRNPRIDLGCAKWCQFAEECLGISPDTLVTATPVVERLMALLDKHLTEHPTRMQHARDAHALAETLLVLESGDPCIIKSAALFAGTFITQEGGMSNVFSPENSSNDDSSVRKALLEQAGISTSVAEEIGMIVDAIRSRKILASSEFDIVWDAIQLDRLFLMQDSGIASNEVAAIIPAMRTGSGKRLAEQYQC